MSDRVLHCWEDSPDHQATCLLEDEHKGPHKFTPDERSDVRVSALTARQERVSALTARQEQLERRRLVVPNPDVKGQNCRGGWVMLPPEPFFEGWRLRRCRCDCGETFKDRDTYRGHYALVHILGLTEMTA